MRRKDKQLTEPSQILAIIRQASALHLALSEQNRPYLIPLCFGYDGTHFYFHTAKQGRKIEIIKNNPHCAFELLAEATLKPGSNDNPCSWGFHYQSVIGRGIVKSLEDREAKQHALQMIMRQYAEQEFSFTDEQLESCLVWAIEVAEIAAKGRCEF